MNKNQKPLRQITFVMALSMALIGGSFAQPVSEKKAIQTAQTQSTPAQSNKITITAPPSANLDSDSAAKKSDKVGSTKPEGTDYRLKVSDAFLAAFTAMLVIVGIFQTIILYKTTAHFKIVERAYIKISHRPPGIEPEGITGLFWVNLEITNSGKTPARVTDVVLTPVVVVPHKKGLPEIPDYSVPAVRDNIPNAFLVTEDKFFSVQRCKIPKLEMTSIMELESDLYLIGFCRLYRPIRATISRGGMLVVISREWMIDPDIGQTTHLNKGAISSSWPRTDTTTTAHASVAKATIGRRSSAALPWSLFHIQTALRKPPHRRHSYDETQVAKTKVGTVIALCERKSGCTLADITTKLRVSEVAAASLIGDARRNGQRVKCESGADGVSRYYL